MYNLAIVDNDEAFCAEAEEYIERYGRETGHLFSHASFPNVLDLLLDYSFQYDIVFIGLSCGIPDGLDTARRLRHIDSAVQIILLDTSQHHAAEGYACNVQGFLVKPVDYASLAETLQRIMKKLVSGRQEGYLILETSRRTARISIDDLLYVESDAHSLIYHTAEREIHVRGNMKDAESALLPHGFCRVKSCCLVNLSRVDEINGCDLCIGDTVLRMSARRRPHVMEQLRIIKNGGTSSLPASPAAAAPHAV